jgi:hypothetical protein
MKRLFVFTTVLVLLVGNSVKAQDLTLSGQVLGEANKPLPLASVFVLRKTNVGTFTDANGRFTIQVTSSDTLSVSHVGYLSYKVAVTDLKSVLVLLPQTVTLKEVIISSKKAKTRKTVLGLAKEKTNSMFCGIDRYALWIGNPFKKSGVIQLFQAKFFHPKNRDPRSEGIMIRLRFYGREKAKGPPSADVVEQSIAVILKPKQTLLKVDIEKYGVPFLAEGMFVGVDILGYVNKNNQLIVNSLPACRSNICLRSTQVGINDYNTQHANWHTGRWNQISNLSIGKNQIVSQNVMLGVEVAFEE